MLDDKLNVIIGQLTTQKPINSIKDSCCNNTSFSVWDFDDFKDNYHKQLGKNDKMTSADALVIRNNTVYFIEMKSCINWKPATETLLDYLKHEKKNIRNKISESFLLFVHKICTDTSLENNELRELFNSNKYSLKFYILLDIDYITYVTNNASISQLKRQFPNLHLTDGGVDIITCNDLPSFFS